MNGTVRKVELLGQKFSDARASEGRGLKFNFAAWNYTKLSKVNGRYSVSRNTDTCTARLNNGSKIISCSRTIDYRKMHLAIKYDAFIRPLLTMLIGQLEKQSQAHKSQFYPILLHCLSCRKSHTRLHLIKHSRMYLHSYKRSKL